ncbi:hypothetical protein RI367_004975 [Sorochytrium milnesiophthora]
MSATPSVKLTKACLSCRRRKRPCDGGTPCDRCTRLKTDCIYTQARKRGPKKKGEAQQLPSLSEVATALTELTELDDTQPSSSADHSPPKSIADELADPLSGIQWGNLGSSTDVEAIFNHVNVSSVTPPPSSLSDILDSMAVGLPCGGFDGQLRAAALGIDLDAAMTVFFRWFNRFAPVFSEQELRMHIATYDAPDHVVYAVAAIAATHPTYPSNRLVPTSQPDYLAHKTQELLLQRLEKSTPPTAYEAYATLLLGLQLTFRGVRVLGTSYINMSLQVLRTVLTPSTMDASSPDARSLCLVFWSLWALDRQAVLFSKNRDLRMNLETCEVTPALPDMPSSPQSLLNATMVFAAFIRISSLNSRVVLWFRNAAQDKTAERARFRSVYALAQDSNETVQTLAADVAAFTSVDSFPPPYLITDPDADLQPLFDRMTDLEAHMWIMTNMMYRLCTLYFDMDAHSKWLTVQLITGTARQMSLPFTPFIVCVATEAANDLIHAGHVLLSPPAPTALDSPSTVLMRATTYPTLQDVIGWYDALVSSQRSCFWWGSNDVAKVHEFVNSWRQLAASI